MCGGTICSHRCARTSSGLSPRVRGNLLSRIIDVRDSGSIPACAGEPCRRRPAHRRLRVYPRVCGGTLPQVAVDPMGKGLSPRVRGNRDEMQDSCRSNGSIPACAGEPRCHTQRMRHARVYPRVCGGTLSQAERDVADVGLSPRVRGNRPGESGSEEHVGSIPACAGEPCRRRGRRCRCRVYPRVCGGTVPSTWTFASPPGLSPRVRGNPRPPCRRGCRRRSIPACAGEPRTACRTSATRRVYPRVCGGTDT